jgi:protein-tyrosine phosphatase
MKVIFVCLGNICRSPAAEAVFKSKVKEEGLSDKIMVDSAGIIGMHSGEKADRRMIRHALDRGYVVDSISRKFNPNSDFSDFDMIIGMDDQNVSDLILSSRNESDRKKIYRMAQFLKNHFDKEIPDPYYGGIEGFNHVLDLLEDACYGLLEKVKKDL